MKSGSSSPSFSWTFLRAVATMQRSPRSSLATRASAFAASGGSAAEPSPRKLRLSEIVAALPPGAAADAPLSEPPAAAVDAMRATIHKRAGAFRYSAEDVRGDAVHVLLRGVAAAA